MPYCQYVISCHILALRIVLHLVLLWKAVIPVLCGWGLNLYTLFWLQACTVGSTGSLALTSSNNGSPAASSLEGLEAGIGGVANTSAGVFTTRLPDLLS